MFKILLSLTTVFLLTISINAQYNGRYTDGEDYAVYFEQTKCGLTIRPVIWTAAQLLRETSRDKFEVVDRTSRGADFTRDGNGKVVGVVIRGMDGEGLKLRHADSPLLPIELLLADRPREAANGYLNHGKLKKAIEAAQQVLFRLPAQFRTIK